MPTTQAPATTATAAAIPRPLRVIAWLSFLAEVLIIGTGGAVRLTGSGLGCPTWPTCTPESIVATPEMGIHGIIEFGNRTLTGLVGILALAVVVLVWRMRRNRPDLFLLAAVVLGGVVAQALIGGVTVLTGLNPFIVGFHYVASVAMVSVCAVFLYRLDRPLVPRERGVPAWYAILIHVATVLTAITVAFGILTTGAGPHSGDAAAGRNGFDAELLQHIHAWPSYALFAVTLVLVAVAWARALPTRFWASMLLGVELVQIVIGLYQARNGLPELAVGAHMVLAALLCAAMTLTVLSRTRPPAPAVESVEPRVRIGTS